MTKVDIRAQIVASIAVKQAVLGDENIVTQIETLAANCVQCLRSGGKIILQATGAASLMRSTFRQSSFRDLCLIGHR